MDPTAKGQHPNEGRSGPSGRREPAKDAGRLMRPGYTRRQRCARLAAAVFAGLALLATSAGPASARHTRDDALRSALDTDESCLKYIAQMIIEQNLRHALAEVHSKTEGTTPDEVVPQENPIREALPKVDPIPDEAVEDIEDSEDPFGAVAVEEQSADSEDPFGAVAVEDPCHRRSRIVEIADPWSRWLP